jgi:dihydrofolate reductase
MVMNAVPKYVATSTGIDAAAWPNSAAIDGDPLAWVTGERERRNIIVIGSLSLVHALAAADLVDEYRLITFPTVTGEGDRLFAAGTPADFRFTLAEPVDAAVLTVLRRDRKEDAE